MVLPGVISSRAMRNEYNRFQPITTNAEFHLSFAAQYVMTRPLIF